MSKNEPGYEITVGHPHYVPPEATEPVVPIADPHEGMEDLSLDARRLRFGHAGLSDHEDKIARAVLGGKRIA